MTKTKCDLGQFDKHGLIYFPCNGKIASIPEWQKLVKSKKNADACNYAILCGAKSKITVLDIDKKINGAVKNGVDIWNALLKQFNNNEDPITPIVKTGGGGYHIFFKYTDKVKTTTQAIKVYNADGIKEAYAVDIRNDNSYVVAAGSFHESKRTYKFSQEFDECETLEMPEWLINAINQDVMMSNDGEITFKPRKPPIKTIELNDEPDESPDNFPQDLFIQILKSLDKSRADDYTQWRDICFGVGGVARKYNWNLQAAVLEFSKQSSKYDEYKTIELYSQASGKIGIGSFWYWLKEDDPVIYNELRSIYNKGKVYYYSDYERLMRKHEERGYLNKGEIREYLKFAFVKINNGGNTRFLSRNKDDDGNDEWELLRNTPFMDNKITVNLLNPASSAENKEDCLKSSFYAILQEFSVHPDFSIYNKLDFRPYLRAEQKTYREKEIFNLFNGFPHNPDGEYDMNIIEPILHHMRNVLCGENEDFYRYYIQYLAHAIQNPAEKPGIAIIFISKQGLGKDLINHDFLKRVFGERLLHRVNDLSAITRKFNKKLEGKLITIIGEIRSYCEATDIEKLKGCISDTTQNIEPKGKDPYEVKDFQRFICHTNNCIPIGITPDDRRFVIHKIADKYVQSREYYNELVKHVKNPAVYKSFFKYLAQMNLDNFDIRTRPETGAKRDLQLLTASNVFRFMADIYTKRWQLQGAKIKDDDIKIHTSKLYENYNRWVLENGEKNKLALKIFKQKTEECGFREYDKKFRTSGSNSSIGYKTTFTEIGDCFKDYITKKEIGDEVEDESPTEDE